MNVHLLNYNNKLNRKVKGYDNFNSYVPYIISSSNEINKSPKDSLNNVFIYNDTADELSGKGRPDYCLLCDDKNNIKSRWFVISCLHKGSNGTYSQYEITIERDIWYDFHETLKESTILCRRGYAPVDSPLILNLDTEEFPMNKIKYKEVLLKEERSDNIDTPWLYLYRSKSTNEINLTGNYDFGNMEDNTVNKRLEKAIQDFTTGLPYDTYLFVTYGIGSYLFSSDDGGTRLYIANYEQLKDIARATGVSASILADSKENLGTDDLMSRNGHSASVARSWGTTVTKVIDTTKLTDADLITFVNAHADADFRYDPYRVTMTEVNGTITLTTARLADIHTEKCVFDIYTAPYNEENLNMMTQLALDSATYDLQILPYGPETYGNSDIYDTVDVEYEVGGNSFIKSMYVCPTSKRKLRIFTPDEFNEGETIGGLTELEPYNLVTTSYREVKKGMNAYEVRLVSPDTQAAEIINPYFNYDGTGLHLINAFDVYMKLQPFNPYIQVKPVYKGYNGINVDDYRGLICGSGFSLAIANDQWTTYQLNNKNYQQQFDREIRTQKISAGIKMVNGLAKSVGQGVMGGAMGGTAGAMAGAYSGVVDTGTQLLADIYNTETAKLEFKWNIENIQNRARTLKNIDAQNPNFKFFPYLEVFKATDEEIERYSLFLMKHGSRINAEGQFKDFIDTDNGTYNYIEGTIDEYEGDDMDAMMLAKASDELNQGIYYEVSEDD